MTRPRPIAAGPPAARSGAAEREAPFSQLLVAVIPPLRAFARGLCGRADRADLVDYIVTEKGVIERPDSAKLAQLMCRKRLH